MAALDDGQYIYIYAQVDTQNNPGSEALAARTTIGDLYTRWEYWTGSVWSANSSDAVKLAGLAGVPVCSQFNVFKVRGKYVLLTQNKDLFSSAGGEIYTFTSNNPQGPWGNKKKIFDTYENKSPYNLMTYNAMAHPQFERDGLIPVSYNVNTENGDQQADDVSAYRPRFFWVEIDRILNN
jgi:hypothetical protein